MKRPLLLLLAVVAAVMLLSGCGSAGVADAATVGSTSISRSQLDDELSTIAANKALAKTLKGQGVELTPTDGGLSTAVSTGWLTSLVNQVFVDRVFKERHLTVSPQDRAAAKTAAEGIFVNAEVFGKFPKSFRDKVIARQERIEAVKSSLPQQGAATDAALQKFFEETKAQFCPSGTVVQHILVATQAEADAVAASLAQGADFATVAAEKSTDTGSADRGGLVACTDSQQYAQLDAAFRAGVEATPVGSVSAPVQTQFGWHVIKVSPWEFETARPVIEQAYAQQQGQDNPLTAFLNRKLVASKLWVDPRYGTIQRTAQTVAIAPPKTPAPKTRPTTTTTQAPASQAPTGQQPSTPAPSSQTPTTTP